MMIVTARVLYILVQGSMYVGAFYFFIGIALVFYSIIIEIIKRL